MVIITFVIPFFYPSHQKSQDFQIEVCGEWRNATFHGYTWGDNQYKSGAFQACTNKKTGIDWGNQFIPMACLSMSSESQTDWIVIDKAPSTPLHSDIPQDAILISSSTDEFKILENLLSKAKYCESEPELILSSRSGDLEKVRRLIKEGKDVNQESISGNFAIIEAVKGEYFEIVQILLESKADTKVSTPIGNYS